MTYRLGVEDAVAALARKDHQTALNIFYAIAGVASLTPEERGWTWCNIGACWEELGDGAKAHYAFRHSASINPKGVAVLSNLGASALGWNRPDEAERYLRSALAVTSDQPDRPLLAHVYNGMATVAIQKGHPESALPWLTKAIQSDPDCVPAHWNRSLALLACGQWDEGWREHEWRKKLKRAAPRTAPVSDKPHWEGERLNGERLLVHCEQGWGDMVQWSRIGPVLKARGATVVWECHAPLYPLFKAQPWCDEAFIAGQADLPSHDLHLWLGSAARVLGVTPETDTTVFPYLRTYKAGRLGDDGKKVVGLVWRGRVEHGTNELRSAPHEFAQEVVDANPDVTWVSFQKDYPPPRGCVDGRPYLTDFATSAAVLRKCDLLVSIDSAPVHLAGAFNVPTLMLLHHNPEWRWRPDLHRGRSRWYRSVEFAQMAEPGNWSSLLPFIREAVQS